jgi:4-hydroxy-2-oxoheptanedioate aldolase
MADIGRLNNIIRAWEEGRPAFASFAHADRQTAIEFSTAPYDGVVFEMEHNPWDVQALGDSLQYLLNRKQIRESASLAPSLTPMARIPSNGVEKNQAFAKQALDRGVFGVIWPHIGDAEEAHNAVASCRYARPKTADLYEPAGRRGDGPASACRYWGLTQPEYYCRADVWPLNPLGEILVFIMCESVRGLANLDDILKNVPGIGCVVIGEGDLSQELGYARQYDHPIVRDAMGQVVATCKKYGVPVGHPHVTSDNVERVVEDGYRFILSAPVRTYDAIKRAREMAAKDSLAGARGKGLLGGESN